MKNKAWHNLILLLWLLVVGTAKSYAEEPREYSQTRIYIANDDHTDYMWTADEQTYENTFVEMIDHHLRLAEATQSESSPYRNRFNCDGSFWLTTYKQQKSQEEFNRLIERIKDGTISVPLNAIASCYGGQPTEAVLRGMYYSGRIERRYGLRFSLAVAMENQTLPLGLASLFAGAGAKYSWRGVCGCASRMDHEPLTHRPHEIYWWKGHDDQQLLLKWHSLRSPGNRSIGGYSEAFDPVGAIEFLDHDAGFLSRYRAQNMDSPYRVRAAFGFGWDALNRKPGEPYLPNQSDYPTTDHFHKIAKEQSNTNRQIIVSNEEDFFLDFEKEYASSIPSVSVTYGNEWDLYSASMSETSARVRRSVEKLRSAELLTTLVSLKQSSFIDKYHSMRDQAFVDLGLFWEHNWTADGPITRSQRAAWQDRLATEIETYVDTIQEAASSRLGRLISSSSQSKLVNSKCYFVLNPLGWVRTDFADIEMNEPRDIHVIDQVTEKEVPFQWMKDEDRVWLRILAENIPSAGYKVFSIVDGPGKQSSTWQPAAKVSSSDMIYFENDRVKVTVARDGAIAGLFDKLYGREYAAVINGLRINDFVANSDSGEIVRVENEGPVSVTLRARSELVLGHTTAITLYRDSPRIDIHNQLTENFSDIRHCSFSFNIDQPVVHSEEVGTINLNRRQSDGGDYADTHARYDYITLNHFADISGATGGVTISNADLAFAKLGNSTPGMLDIQTPQINVLAGGQIDGPELGIRNQNGNKSFAQRFALRLNADYKQTDAMRFSIEHQNRLVTGKIEVDSINADFPSTEFSLVQSSNPNVLVWAIKPAEVGIETGVVIRLWNQSAQDERTEIGFAKPIKTANRATHIETLLEPIEMTNGKLIFDVGKQKIETVTIKVNSAK